MKKAYLFLAVLVCSFNALLHAQIFTQGNLQVDLQLSATHDSTTCHSTYTSTMTITVQNSYTGQVLEIINQPDSSLLQTQTNTSGTNPWVITMPAPAPATSLDDYQATALGYTPFAGYVLKIICGADTIHNIDTHYDLDVPNPCEYTFVNGRIYIDNDGDCTYNGSDEGLSGLQLYCNTYTSGGYLLNSGGSMSSSDGTYPDLVTVSWFGFGTINLPQVYQVLFPSAGCTQIPDTFYTLTSPNIDIPLHCSHAVDVQAQVHAGGPTVRPQVPFFLYPNVSNTGCTAVSGQLTLVLDNNVTYNPGATINPPTSITGNTLVWDYTNLTNITNGTPYWNSLLAGVNLTPNPGVGIGDTLCFNVFADVPANDADPANNVASICIPVVASYDPNEKEVSPKGTGLAGNIPQSTSELNYTIYFQNTGTAAAFNVRITDTFDANLDLNSFKITGNSAAVTPVWTAPGVMSFYFNNINLADSNSNEPASHGFISYSLKVDSNLAIGTQIKNTAYIYFDNNPAVVTNSTLNTIAGPENVSNVSAGTRIAIYPNPATDHITIEAIKGNSLNNRRLLVSNTNGSIAIDKLLTANKTQLDISDLSNGVYFIKIIDEHVTTVGKFTKL